MAEGGSPDVEAQKNEIATLIKTPLKKGDTWYLIDSRWFKLWKKFVRFDSWDMHQMGQQSLPGPVDNSGLLKETEEQTLKENLIDELDYVLVPTEAWNKLVSWYGCMEGQKPIARKVVEHGMFVKHCKVEVYLTELKLCENGDVENSFTRHFSKADTIDTIEKEMKKLFEIPEDKETRLWNKYTSNTYEPLNKLDSSIQDAGLCQGQVLIIEQKNEDGTWPRQFISNKASSGTSGSFPTSPGLSSASSSLAIGSSTYSSGYGRTSSSGYNSYGYSSYDYREPGRGTSQPGLCGLSNLGNTCFMNSAIQCLSNTPPLTEYFVNNKYVSELNNENPLGMKGEIAKAYADLTKQIWSGRYSYVTPRAFKTQVGRFAPQFSGYQQQDSQELLAFLLDGLHEDLNRILNKPYVELKDAEGRPDEVVAREAWDNHQKRNNSIIVDIFHGLFKSTLVCPECSKVSVTFDPFCYLTLPLPMKKERNMEVFLICMDPRSKPTQYKVTVPKSGQISDLCVALSKLSGVPAHKMVVADVYNHRFHKIFQMDEKLNNILERDDIFVYEVAGGKQDDPEQVVLPVYHREKRIRHNSYNCNLVSTGMLFGQPLFISVPRNSTTCRRLYHMLLDHMARYVNRPSDDEEDDEDHYDRPLYVDQNNANNMRYSRQNGEVDMEEEESSMDRELPSENEDSQSDESADNEEESERCRTAPANDNVAAKQQQQQQQAFRSPRRRPLFTFHVVNAYGNSEVNTILDDGRPIKLVNQPYIALDWDPELKRRYYDEKAAEDFERHESMQSQPTRKHSVRLRDCIELFTTKERLGVEDPWYCPSCKRHQQATKKFDLWSLPHILVVHLKRFSYSRYLRDKLDTLVDFPFRNLDMAEFVINPEPGPCKYDLIAVSNHYGGMGGGHYTAFAKNKDDGYWYYFDDSSVSPATEDQIVSKAAYVLFYQRQDAASKAHGAGAARGAAAMAAPPSPRGSPCAATVASAAAATSSTTTTTSSSSCAAPASAQRRDDEDEEEDEEEECLDNGAASSAEEDSMDTN
ncbi:ubiquitin carboxyl-terminal hydrolase 15-like isoform X1 [Lampetra fluviatilis]